MNRPSLLTITQAMSLCVSAAFATFVIWRVSDSAPPGVLIAGGLPILIVLSLWATGLVWWHRPHNKNAMRLHDWIGFYTAVFWGGSLAGANMQWFFMPWADETERLLSLFIVITITCGTALGSTRIPSSPWLAAATWTAPAVLPFSTALWYVMHGGELAIPIALFLLTGTAVLMLQRGFVRRAHARMYESERKALAAQRELETERDARQRFLASASHDLGQPLQSARLFFDLAIRETDVLRRGESIKATQDSLSRLEDQLTQIQNHLRLNAGAQRVRKVSLSIAGAISGACDQAEPLIARAGVQLHLVSSSLRVLADPVFLERIIRNYIDNAIRHSRCQRVLIGSRRRGDRVRIYVIDDGEGISINDRDALFSDYFQGSNHGDEIRGGFGIGLASVRRMAIAMDGSAGLDLWWTHGCAFFVELPRAPLIASRS